MKPFPCQESSPTILRQRWRVPALAGALYNFHPGVLLITILYLHIISNSNTHLSVQYRNRQQTPNILLKSGGESSLRSTSPVRMQCRYSPSLLRQWTDQLLVLGRVRMPIIEALYLHKGGKVSAYQSPLPQALRQ
jgi:hypothetical protein